MEEITAKLKQNKPEITASSLKAYLTNLQKLHQRLHGSREFESIDWLQDHQAVLGNVEAHAGSYLTRRCRRPERRRRARLKSIRSPAH